MTTVNFTYTKGGRVVPMQRRYAETLRRLGHGTYPDTSAAAPVAAPAFLIADKVAEFAKENHVALAEVKATGKDGRITKADIEAVISAREDLA